MLHRFVRLVLNCIEFRTNNLLHRNKRDYSSGLKSKLADWINTSGIEIGQFFNNNQTAMNSILITGCSRGLGLGLVKQLLESNKPTKHIFATCRYPDKAQVTWIFIADNHFTHFFKWYQLKLHHYHMSIQRIVPVKPFQFIYFTYISCFFLSL